MTDDDPTVVRQIKQVLKRDRYDGEEKRAPQPMTVTDYIKFLPLVAVILAGVTGYVRTQSDVEVLRRDVDRAIEESKQAHTELKDWNIELSKRLRDHKDNQH